jgi:HlyD family secretion protein
VNRRTLSIIIVVGVLAVSGFFVYRLVTRGSTRANAVANLQTAQVQRGTVVASVNAAGAITAPGTASLAWQTTGIIGKVNVAVGDSVKAGDVLMELDPKSLSNSVIQAQADLVAAQENLDTLMAGPTLQQVAQAKLNVIQAQQTVTTTQQKLNSALGKVPGQALLDSVRNAKSALDTAQANLQLASVSPTVTALQSQVFVTNYYHRQYDDLVAKYGVNPSNPDLATKVQQAQNAYQIQLDKQLTLQYQIDTNTASLSNSVQNAQSAYDQALANQQAVQQGPDAATVALLQAQVDMAKGNLDQAQTDLAKLLASPDPKDVAAAQAKVAAAQAIVDSPKLVAPFAATVVAVDNHVGDSINTNQAAIVIADLSSLQVQVNISEVDINSVALGQTVNLTVDAASGRTFPGQVTQVANIGQSAQNVVTFPVTVVISGTDAALKPGMTAAVAIVTAEHPNVLTVPNRAIRATGGQRMVTVLFEGQQIPVPVTVGLTNGSVTEITDGSLKDGDTVVINTTTTTTANRAGGGGGFFGLFGGFRGP